MNDSSVITENGVSNTIESFRPKNLLLQWHLTNRCNLRCKHCYQESYGGAELSFGELLGILDQYESLLDEWRTLASPRSPVRGQITFTGGEPFVRSDFIALLEHVARKREKYSFAILTNGSLIDLRIARKLRALRPRFVQVSMEGTEATHDSVRGPGDFQRTIKAIKLLRRFGVKTMLSFTAHPGNYREFSDVARIGIKLGIDRVWSDRLIPSTVSKGQFANESLSAEQTREFFLLMAAAKREAAMHWLNRTEISMHRALQFLVDGGDAYHCTAGSSLITVMPDGEVYPCRRMPISVGNLRHSSLKDIYYHHPLLQQLRNPQQSNQGCEQCVHVLQCRGGLKCLSFATAGSPFHNDPGCWLATGQAQPEGKGLAYVSPSHS
jgi:radical SAM protein with 4Fe4S-binding SPASM domain